MSDALLLGLDIGGTASRALLADEHGHRLGFGTAAGGNPSAHHVPDAVGAVETAVRAALDGFDPGQVTAAVVGMAGVGRMEEPTVRQAFDAMWHQVGLRCPYRTVADAVVAFAAGTAAPDGTLLLAGTGAIAAQLRDRTLLRIADGHGWLLGDLGSGFWLGREAVRATLAHLDGWTPDSPLVRKVLADLLGVTDLPPSREAVTAVINAVRRQPPVSLARFAPVVCEVAAAGDPGAGEIVARAAGHLVDSANRVRTGGDGPLVLAGSLLTADTPLAAEVRSVALRQWPGVPIGVAADGAAGAVWLAALDSPSAASSPEELHATLLGT